MIFRECGLDRLKIKTDIGPGGTAANPPRPAWPGATPPPEHVAAAGVDEDSQNVENAQSTRLTFQQVVVCLDGSKHDVGIKKILSGQKVRKRLTKNKAFG